MSAISGIFNRSGQERSHQEIDAMLGVMATRGPDRRSTWANGPVNLGHGLLIATPEAAHESQPFTDPATGNTIVADIRLDNRAELISALGFQGRRSDQLGDAELALAAYGKWGEEYGSRLLGAFAIAVWDEQRQALVLTRDHFGVRPLTYFASDELFAFASDARAILAIEGVPCEPDRDRVFDFVISSVESVDFNSTFFRSVNRLTPASSLVVQRAGISTSQYWHLKEPPVLRVTDPREYLEAHDEIFGEAVRCRLRGRDDAGIMLSGGIDSAAIAAFAADQGTARAFSGISVDINEPETRRIRMAADALSLDLHTVTKAETNALLGSFSSRVRSAENLFGIEQTMTTAVSKRAALQGQRSLLSGIFANEVTQERLEYIIRLLAARRRYGAAALQLDPTGKLSRKLRLRGLARMLVAAAPASVRRRFEVASQERWARSQGQRIDEACLIFQPGERQRLEQRMDRRRRQPQDNDGPGSARTELFARHYAAAALERYDNDAAGQSIEIRSPYMDTRLVNFWLSLPSDQLMWRGWDKVLLRRSMAGRIPREVAWCRSHEHLGYSFTQAWLDFDPQDLLRNVGRSHPVRTFVDIDAIRAATSTEGSSAEDSCWEQALLAEWLDSMF